MGQEIRALVHGGGGSKSAWGSGVLRYLLGDLKLEYQIYTGISSGAINTSFIAQFTDGQEASKQLYDLWSNLNTKDIYRRWQPFGAAHAIWRSSLYNSVPLKELLYKHISLDKIRTVGKEIRVGCVNLQTGKYHLFGQDHPNFIDAVIGSASFPGLLAPVKINLELWSDGGSKQISDIAAAIDLGATEIDVVITSPEVRIKKFIEHPSTIDILKRALDLATDKIMANDIEKVIMYNKLAAAGLTDKKVVKLNIFRPKFNLTDDLLDFDNKKLNDMLKLGYQDAKDYFANNST